MSSHATSRVSCSGNTGSCPVTPLVGYLVLVVLDHVVGLATPAQVAVAHHLAHVGGRLELARLRLEARSQLLDGVSTETGQAGVKHEGDEGDDCLVVRPARRTDTGERRGRGETGQAGVEHEGDEGDDRLVVRPARRTETGERRGRGETGQAGVEHEGDEGDDRLVVRPARRTDTGERRGRGETGQAGVKHEGDVGDDRLVVRPARRTDTGERRGSGETGPLMTVCSEH